MPHCRHGWLAGWLDWTGRSLDQFVFDIFSYWQRLNGLTFVYVMFERLSANFARYEVIFCTESSTLQWMGGIDGPLTCATATTLWLYIWPNVLIFTSIAARGTQSIVAWPAMDMGSSGEPCNNPFIGVSVVVFLRWVVEILILSSMFIWYPG